MANRLAQLQLLARFCSLVCASAALGIYNGVSSSHGTGATAVRSSYLALSGLVTWYALLLLIQAGLMVMGWTIPLPEGQLPGLVVIVVDWVLAIVTFGTASAAVSVIQIAGQWGVFVHYVEARYVIYSIVALLSGFWASLTCICETMLAMDHRVPLWWF